MYQIGPKITYTRKHKSDCVSTKETKNEDVDCLWGLSKKHILLLALEIEPWVTKLSCKAKNVTGLPWILEQKSVSVSI